MTELIATLIVSAWSNMALDVLGILIAFAIFMGALELLHKFLSRGRQL